MKMCSSLRKKIRLSLVNERTRHLEQEGSSRLLYEGLHLRKDLSGTARQEMACGRRDRTGISSKVGR